MKPSLLIPILTLATLPAFAGEAPVGKTPVPPPPTPAANPLSFFGGKLVLDFEAKARFEARENNFDFNGDVDTLTDDSWLLERVRFGTLFAPTSYLKFYAQAQDAREFFSDRPDIPGQLGAEGNDKFDLRQAWIEIGDAKSSVPLTLKVGRQPLSYGDERLIGGFEWNNIGRVFDAAKLTYTGSTWSLDAFGASIVNVSADDFNESDLTNGLGRDQFFGGLYFSTKALEFQTTDLYALYLDEKSVTGDTSFVTLGSRIKSTAGKLNGFDYDFEGALQFGDVKGKDLSAGAMHAGTGYTFANAPWKPRIGIEYNYATGDSTPGDNNTDTFQNLFPTNHKFYGYADFFSWQNIHNPALQLKLTPSRTVTLQADYHLFWLAETADGWYRANGVTKVRPPAPGKSASSFVGSELDLTATWKATKNFGFQAGYSHFFSGDYAKASGPSDDADFVYTQMTISF
jgi:Alginate export